MNTPQADISRARQAGVILYKAFKNPEIGIFDKTVMPEDILPEGMARGTYEHRLFITLSVSVDYLRDANGLWEASRRTFEDENTLYLFSPQYVYEVPLPKLKWDMQKYKLAKRPNKDSWIWRTNAVSLLKKWNGDPLNLIRAVNFDAVQLLERIRNDKHAQGTRLNHNFPFLRGKKIAVLWIRMLRDNIGLDLKNIPEIPIPVDTHIARATRRLASGHLQKETSLEQQIQAIWREAAKGTNLVALDFDEPLWHLSKYGCSKCINNRCPMMDQCPVSRFCIV